MSIIAAERVVEPVRAGHRAAGVIEHVAEIGARALVDARLLGLGKLGRDLLHPPGDVLEPPELAAQAEDPADPRLIGETRDCVVLHLADHLLELVEQWRVAVDDEVEHRVEHEVGPFGEPLGHRLELRAQREVCAFAAVTHGHQEIPAEQQCGLAVGDLVALAHRRGAGDDEQLVAEMLGLGRIALAQRVLDCERVQVVARLDVGHLVGGRVDQPDPVELGPFGRGAVARKLGIDQLSVPVAPCGHDRHGAEWWQRPPREATRRTGQKLNVTTTKSW
jgi:hypothetical protein